MTLYKQRNMRHHGLAACALILALGVAACSTKSVAGPDGPDGSGAGGGIVFFNWLPALLTDQAYAQHNHEIMQFLDDPANWDDRAAMQSLLDRLAGSPAEYRLGANVQPTDQPILYAIAVSIEQARRYLAGELQIGAPRLQRDQG